MMGKEKNRNAALGCGSPNSPETLRLFARD